jgi:CRP-like cAMP-binding protein
MISILRQHLTQNTKLDHQDIDNICRAFVSKTFKVDEAIIPVDSKVTLIGFIVEGILRAVEHKPSGNRTIHYFIHENHFFSEADGLFKNKPARLAIEAATPSIVLCSSIEAIFSLAQSKVVVEQALSERIGRELVDIIEAQEILHKGKSHERYLEFIKQKTGIANRLKDKDIAAYLGISKYTLSHIKKRI